MCFPQAAFLAMNHVGGKLLLFQAAAPSLGIGKIKQRENLALYGTDKVRCLAVFANMLTNIVCQCVGDRGRCRVRG